MRGKGERDVRPGRRAGAHPDTGPLFLPPSVTKGVAVSNEENFDLIRRFNKTPGTRDLNVLDELIAPDYIAHGGEQEIRGRDAWKQFLLAGHAQFGASENGIEELIGNGNLVAERWWIRTAASTRRGITIHRIENGKIQEDWAVWEDINNNGAAPQG
jgi:hypothetical protein